MNRQQNVPRLGHSSTMQVKRPVSQSAFTFSPPKRIKTKDNDENQSPPVLLLAQFQPKEYLQFKDVEVGSSKTLQVCLQNPASMIQDVDFKKFPSVDKGFRVEQRFISVMPNQKITLDITWEPTQPLKISESIYLQTSCGHSLQIVLIGKAFSKKAKPVKVGPNRKGALGARARTFQVIPQAPSASQVTRQKAAILIQKSWRGYWARKQIIRQIIAAITIQRHVRGYLVRKDIAHQTSAAITIQRYYRNYRARCIQAEATKLHDAAIVIQKHFRGFLARKRVKRQKAAIFIQKSWRGYWARKQIIRQITAAITIQRCIRGYLVRKEIARQTAATIAIQRYYRNYRARCIQAEAKRLQEAAITIQRCIRGYLVRKEIARQTSAAIAIQSYYRKYRARCADAEAKRLCKAATIIQRCLRGYLVRKEISRQTAAAVAIQRCYREYRARCVRAEAKRLVEAVINVQRYLRGYLVRKEIARQTAAAISIQRCYREYKARCIDAEAKRLQKASIIIQKRFRGYLVRKEISRRTGAAIAIQRYYRNYRARCADAEEKRLVEAVIKVQRYLRGCLVRKEIARQTAAAIAIQRYYREYRARCADAEAERLREAAIIVQKHFRGRLVRKEIARQTAAAIIIQRYYRKYRAHCTEERRLHEAAIIIQKRFRGFLARKRVYAELEQIETLRRRVSLLECPEEQRLGNRTAAALEVILRCDTYEAIADHLESLVSTTRLSPESCMTISQAGACRVLLTLTNTVNRGPHSQWLICPALDILINLSKCPQTWPAVAKTANILTTIINLIKRNINNPEITSKGLTLMYILVRNPADPSTPKLDTVARKVLTLIFDTIQREITKKGVKRPRQRAPAFNPFWSAKPGAAVAFKNKYDAYFYLKNNCKLI